MSKIDNTVIKFDGIGTDWLLYKYPNEEVGANSRIIVGPGQIAIGVHNGKIESILEAGTTILNPQHLSWLARLVNKIKGKKNAFPVEFYFINKKLKLDFLFGTATPIDVIDPVYKIKIRLRARGQMGVKIENYQYFFQTLVGTIGMDDVLYFDTLTDFLKGIINQKLRKHLATAISKKKISYFDINAEIDEIADAVKKELQPEFTRLGFLLANLSFESIDAPEEDLAKLTENLNDDAGMSDYKYRRKRGYDVMQDAARNTGNTGAMMGIGIGGNMANMMGNNMGNGGLLPSQEEAPAAKPANTIACPSCGAECKANAKFCPECGCKLQNTCPECGAAIKPNAKFCPECGAKLTKGKKGK